MSEICRTCMSHNEEMIPIFTGHNNGHHSACKPIDVMIMEIASLELLQSDKLPSKICGTCLENLQIAYSFKEQIIQSNNALLQELTSNLHAFQDLERKAEFYPGEHKIKLEDTDEEIASNYGFGKFQRPSDCDVGPTLIQYPKSEDLTKTSQAIAKSKEYERSAQDINNTFKEEHDENLLAPIEHVEISPGKYADFSESDENNLELSQNSQSDQDENDEHEQENETGAGIYKCSYCNFKFTKKSGLHVHMRTHARKFKAKSFKCEVCDSRFAWKKTLKVHMRIHTGEKPFKCEYCEETFVYQNKLTDHIRTHTGEQLPNLNKCEECGKSFKRLFTLKSHMRVHTGEKPFKCEYCDATFSQNCNLKKHYNKHTGEKLPRLYKCHLCPSSFALSSILQTHIRTHTGEKPYKCQYCDATFTQNGNLRQHIRTHTRDKGKEPYKCEVCGKGFWRSDNLIVHMRSHTGEKPFKCQYCDQSFTYNVSLKKHMTKHTHEIKLEPTDQDMNNQE